MLSSTRHLLQGEPAKQHRDAVARIDACWCLPVSLVQCPQQKHFECGGAAVPQGAVKTAQIPPLPLFEGGVHWSLACALQRQRPAPAPPDPRPTPRLRNKICSGNWVCHGGQVGSQKVLWETADNGTGVGEATPTTWKPASTSQPDPRRGCCSSTDKRRNASTTRVRPPSDRTRGSRSTRPAG